MEELSVGSSSYFINNSWFKIEEDSSWYVLTGSGFGEEGVEGIIAPSHGLVSGHLTIRLDAVFETVEFPAAVTGLDTGLAHMDGDTF